MRKTLIWQTTRKALTVTALAAFVTGGAFFMSGTASAATTLADGCTGAVSGSMGDQVAVKGSVVSGMVKQAAQESVKYFLLIPVNGVNPDKLSTAINGQTMIVGKIPNTAGSSIASTEVAKSVAAALQNADGLGNSTSDKQTTLTNITNKVAGACAAGLTTIATDYTAPTTPNSNTGTGTQNGGTYTAPGTPGNLSLGTGGVTGTAPQRDYGNIPSASPGFAVPPGVRYPSNSPLPGDQQAPQFGIAGANGQSGQGTDVRNAGNAESLASSGVGSDVQLPMLLAVVVLAGVTAALVRTWVLRRV
ncbi:hypothetical protein [Amycolatopsis sp. H20-H5]|uniref:hypothetical protein n=1 Tax=Amycolatopsis sp. H20-H5 TaxID=3046309 RepID=UPI002DB9BE41|nr:hypothetical protein [Amycolatopsis sp. H20-H5]MEC3974680.1 hypothetical protein [Amycolatopsis sp. H20-H5]